MNGGRHDDQFEVREVLQDKFDDEREKVVLQLSLVDFVENEMGASAQHVLGMVRQRLHHVAGRHEEEAGGFAASVILTDAIPDFIAF